MYNHSWLIMADLYAYLNDVLTMNKPINTNYKPQIKCRKRNQSAQEKVQMSPKTIIPSGREHRVTAHDSS